MIKLLLDMGAAVSTADHLRRAGHDAVHSRELGLQQTPDPDVINLASREGRIIVTFDLDFSRIIALSRSSEPSVILFRLERYSTPEINATLLRLLDRHAASLQSGVILIVDPARIRIRSLPIE